MSKELSTSGVSAKFCIFSGSNKFQNVPHTTISFELFGLMDLNFWDFQSLMWHKRTI